MTIIVTIIIPQNILNRMCKLTTFHQSSHIRNCNNMINYNIFLIYGIKNIRNINLIITIYFINYNIFNKINFLFHNIYSITLHII